MCIQKSAKYLLATLVASAMLGSQTFASDRGELLYENHCQSCHNKNVHTRENRLVKSPESLRAWVYSWAIHNNLQWSEEEIADITAYLNRTHYHFPD
jgi:mono/diheme cytochrome c family protein